jgi:hypothetical protein
MHACTHARARAHYTCTHIPYKHTHSIHDHAHIHTCTYAHMKYNSRVPRAPWRFWLVNPYIHTYIHTCIHTRPFVEVIMYTYIHAFMHTYCIMGAALFKGSCIHTYIYAYILHNASVPLIALFKGSCIHTYIHTTCRILWACHSSLRTSTHVYIHIYIHTTYRMMRACHSSLCSSESKSSSSATQYAITAFSTACWTHACMYVRTYVCMYGLFNPNPHRHTTNVCCVCLFIYVCMCSRIVLSLYTVPGLWQAKQIRYNCLFHSLLEAWICMYVCMYACMYGIIN